MLSRNGKKEQMFNAFRAAPFLCGDITQKIRREEPFLRSSWKACSLSIEGKMLKDVMTSFDVAAVTHEINTLVEGAHVSKIYQIGTQTLLLKLRKPNMP